MKAIIERSEPNGKIFAPASKSQTHRALICASLAEGKSLIVSPLYCDDTEVTVNVLRACGIGISGHNDGFEIQGGRFSTPSKELYCWESGTTLRFMTGFCSLVGRSRLTCGNSLKRRPIGPLVDSLKELGVDCRCEGGYPPVEVGKKGIEGGETTLPGDVSSQFLSSLLLVSPFATKSVIRLTTPLQSKPYVSMTLEMQKRFGIKIETYRKVYSISRQNYIPATVNIEGDWSSASFLLAAGALAGEVEIKNLNFASSQGDKSILEVLKEMGAEIEIDQGSAFIEKKRLKSINVDVSNCPDLFPVVCVLSASAKGVSRITGIERLKIKESNRIEAMREGLEKMGVKMGVDEKNGEVSIDGGAISGETIDPRGDHRIAMAFAVLGLIAEGKTIIRDTECVSKSFPDFWERLKELNCEVVNE